MMHTKGPWHKGRAYECEDWIIFARGIPWQLAYLRDDKRANWPLEANARRIVACVNALEGFDIAAIEAGVVKQLVEALEATTHEVEATIRCITNEQTRNEMQAVADKARNALALITPSQELQEQG